MSADTIDVLVRQHRMRAATLDPQRGTSDAIAAMAAGSGAELVARQQLARDVLDTRLGKRLRANADQAGRPE